MAKIIGEGFLGAATSPVGTHTMAHATLVGHRGSGSNLRSPPPNWCPPLITLFHEPLGVSKMPSRKADQLTFNIGYTGDV